jgi:hypothetical protein
MDDDLLHEGAYDRRRLAQFLAGAARADGVSRRDLMLLAAAAAGLAVAPVAAPGEARARTPAAPTAAGPIVKPLPPELFTVYGTNAEMRWSAMKDQGYLVPVDRFFVRNHTSTPIIDADTWSLKLFGAGLRGAPTAETPVEFSLRELRRLPAETITASVECAGNGRSYYTTQQGQTVSGTAWKLGAVRQAGRQERIRARCRCASTGRAGHPAHRTVVVAERTDPPRRGERRRRPALASRPPRRSADWHRLAALGDRLATRRARRVRAAGPRDRPERRHPARRGALQHSGLPLRRRRAAPGPRRLSRPGDPQSDAWLWQLPDEGRDSYGRQLTAMAAMVSRKATVTPSATPSGVRVVSPAGGRAPAAVAAC